MINHHQPDYTNTPVSSKRPAFNYLPGDYHALPAISIITPFYNTPPEIFNETARSIFQQSFQQWEWLIINDGSNNLNAIQGLEKYRNLDYRIRVIDLSENQGLSTARNVGFRNASTPYVLQIDSDDLLEPTATEKWLCFLETNPEFGFVKGYSVGFGALEYLWTRGFHERQEFLQTNLVEATSLIRKDVHQTIGGYDESNRSGLEDWDFWLKCAAHGYWGDTIPEYLSWYRRRPNHGQRWHNWGNEKALHDFRSILFQRYTPLWQGNFPEISKKWHMPYDTVPFSLPFHNIIAKEKKRLLLIVPWLSIGGADKFNLDLVKQLSQRNWEITIVTTSPGDCSWETDFFCLTPDIFVLNRFLSMVNYPRFLQYLIQSRQPDVVLITNSELGYMLLPYLRATSPQPVYVDFCHMEEEYWKNGGYPRKALIYQQLLDVNIVASKHLKNWMIKNGGVENKIEVCYINVDTQYWRPDPLQREKIREELGISANSPIILFVGRITSQKRPLVLAQVLWNIEKKGQDFYCVIVGNGPEKSDLENFISHHGKLSHRVKILGARPSSDVRNLMQAADIFFLPSAQEGIALTLYEALSCGLPVVSADIGGQSELVSGDCGMLLPRMGEIQEIEQYSQILVDILQNDEKRKEMGLAGRRRMESFFSINNMATKMLAIFDDALYKRKTTPYESVPIAVGQVAAHETIESLRLFYLAEELWQYRETAFSNGPIPFKIYIYLKSRNLLLPIYIKLGGERINWLQSLKKWIKTRII